MVTEIGAKLTNHKKATNRLEGYRDDECIGRFDVGNHRKYSITNKTSRCRRHTGGIDRNVKSRTPYICNSLWNLNKE
jgi:hypothetical protein